MNPETTGLTASDLAQLTQAAQQHPEIETLTLFGSRAKGTHRKGSDVDLAVQGAGVTDETIARLADQLNEQLPLPYFFDVLNYNTLSDTELKAHITRVGRTLYKGSVSMPNVLLDSPLAPFEGVAKAGLRLIK